MIAYLCPHCAREHGEEDPGSWFPEADLPLHLNLVHNHRLRDIYDIVKDWRTLGVLTTKEVEPEAPRTL